MSDKHVRGKEKFMLHTRTTYLGSPELLLVMRNGKGGEVEKKNEKK